MTAKATRVWVELTDEQMDLHTPAGWGVWSASYALWHAIKAQRPRPIAVGDRVHIGVDQVGTVEVIKDQQAWVWHDGSPWGSYSVADLTRADDEMPDVACEERNAR